MGAAFIPFIAGSFGGLSDDAVQLVQRMANAAQHMQVWHREQIMRHVLCNIAVAYSERTQPQC